MARGMTGVMRIVSNNTWPHPFHRVFLVIQEISFHRYLNKCDVGSFIFIIGITVILKSSFFQGFAIFQIYFFLINGLKLFNNRKNIYLLMNYFLAFYSEKNFFFL